MEQTLDIRRGDRVYFKPEWQDAGDTERVFRAMEDYDGSGRIAVECANTGLFVNPWQIVGIETVEMVERKEKTEC